ncbi:DUF2225 domain-containing protein [Paenibacillus turpanensis]|uniref:DUF2225 domain-containing protein n=1 Tax=Paenibacillus turpanensis TaxID=2689078 RepID=UPI00140B3236|nr:DUF2225 domain-containing protein [Paenibacillus turpanensis]
MVSPLYQTQVQCSYCENTFETSRVRSSFKKAVQTDSDFCLHYKEINPDYYVVRVCSWCGYASTENFSDRFTPKHKALFKEKVADHWTMKQFGGERTWDMAMQTYKLGLVCAQIKEESPRIIAGLLHHIAWLHRYKGETEQENRFLQFALEAYVRTYEVESGAVNNARLMYMLGELNRRLKNYHEAVKWFGRVINDKSIMDAGMIRASREMWQATREDMLAEKLELPEEMNEQK